MGVGRGATTLPCKRENVEKPPRNSVGFCGGDKGLNWAVELRKEEQRKGEWKRIHNKSVINIVGKFGDGRYKHHEWGNQEMNKPIKFWLKDH
jgi:hypothetical protein